MTRQRSSHELLFALPVGRLRAGNFYTALRKAILEGRLRAGTRVPSSREMAHNQGVARGTVVAAYEQLCAEGYLQARSGSGTRVSAVLPDALLAATEASKGSVHGAMKPVRLSRRGALLARTPFPAQTAPAGTPFAPHLPALQEFPIKLWASIVAKRARALTADVLCDGDAGGHPPLRRAIADYLGSARGVRCTQDQVIVLSSVQQALDLTVRLLLDEGDAAWIENPGYGGALAVLRAAGIAPCPIPVDAGGMDVDWATQRHPTARLAYVTPAHQAPLGMSLPLARRLALLAWARRENSWIFEDDYDSEYRYFDKPLAPLQSLGDNAPVLYSGCFSKTLFPALRVAYLVVPAQLVDAFTAARSVTSRYPPLLDQLALAEFMDEGHYARHLRRMRQLYAQRRALLVELLDKHLGGKLEILDNPTGLNLACWLAPEISEAGALQRCRDAGLLVHTLGHYNIDKKKPLRPGLLLGFASLTPSTLRVATAKLARALGRTPLNALS